MNTENLLKLARKLEKPLPKNYKFDMEELRAESSCGTVCCALGYAPDIEGLERNDDEMSDSFVDTHSYYSHRVFGFDDFDDRFQWCFAPEWSGVDNSKSGAAKRIRWLVKYGLPDDWEEQIFGSNPLCYK